MATELTASIASGYMTDVQYVAMGNRRVIEGHYSSPSNATMYIRTGMPILTYFHIPHADVTTYAQATDGAGGINLYFSGFVAGATGFFKIEGQ
jgi:hypothetical protein